MDRMGDAVIELAKRLNVLSILSILGAFLLVRAILNHVRRERLAKKLRCHSTGPQYPYYDRIWGLDYMWENARKILAYQFAQGVRERFQQYGTTYYAVMGFQKIVHTIDPENLEALMKTNFDDYVVLPDRSKLVSVLLGPGVFTHNGDQWRRSRALVHWSLGNLHVDVDMLETHAQSMIATFRAQSRVREKGGRSIDFGAVAGGYTFNVAAALMFGNKLAGDSERFAADFAHVGKIGQALTIFIFMNTHLVFWNHIRPAQRRLFSFVDAYVKRALGSPNEEEGTKKTKKQGRKHDSIIEGLATQTQDVERIRSEALNLFLAGSDTVKIGFVEQMWYLARSPAAWARLRSEVAQFNGRPATLSELRELTYVRWVINEAARLGPTLSVHGRKAIHDTVLPRGGGADGQGALLVEKGTYVAYSNYALHRNPAVFGADVDRFRPERWADIAPGKFEYLGFGAGPRFCPGKEVGWAIVAYATVRLAQEFETVSPPEEDRPWQEAASFSFYNRHGCHMIMKPVEA